MDGGTAVLNRNFFDVKVEKRPILLSFWKLCTYKYCVHLIF